VLIFKLVSALGAALSADPENEDGDHAAADPMVAIRASPSFIVVVDKINFVKILWEELVYPREKKSE